jgi:hypothetical protein
MSSTFVQPSFPGQNITQYKTNIDDSFAVTSQVAAGFNPFAEMVFDFIPAAVSVANNTITVADHSLLLNDIGQFTVSGNVGDVLPTGLSLTTDYHIISSGLTSGVFKVSASSGGAEIDITGIGQGIFTFTLTAGMTMRLFRGAIPVENSLPTSLAVQETSTITAPSVNPRKDLVLINSITGVLSVVTGAEAASPVDPSVTAGTVPIGRINMVVSQTQILNADIDDLRVHPWLGGAGSNVDAQIADNKFNIALLAFLRQTDQAASVLFMVNGYTDAFEDETGVDGTNSVNELYDGTGDFYGPNQTDLSESHLSGTPGLTLGDVGDVERRHGQGFTISSTGTVTAVDVDFGANAGSPSGDVTLRIETDSSGPTGTLAHANATKAITPTASTLNTWTFDTPFELTGSTKYWIVLACDNQSTGVYWLISQTADSSYANGGKVESTDGGATWGAESGTNDLYFKLHASASTNMTLIAEIAVALVAPDDAHITLFKEDVDAITLNTDLLGWASRSKRSFTATNATNVLDDTSNPYTDDMRVILTSSAADLPDGLDSETVYFVVNQATNSFQVSLTSGGAVVTFSDDGIGTHQCHVVTLATLVKEATYTTFDIVAASVDVSAQPSDTDMGLFVQSKNNKDFKLHGQSLQWSA